MTNPADHTPPQTEPAQRVLQLARDAGFDLVGLAPVAPSQWPEAYRQWLAAGKHGAMDYLAKHVDERLDLRQRFPWARSILCVALAYYQESPPPAAAPSATEGKIARYAWGRDYHRALGHKLTHLEKRLRAEFSSPADPTPFQTRAYVDTGPLLERELAARAGLGWIGKHTLLIHPRHGSYFLLGELLTSLDLTPSSPPPPPDPSTLSHCGTCTRCLDACPTAAITPYSVDATKCLSYQTLENRAEIPPALHAPLQHAGFLVGCDICQEVCPFNRHPLPTHEPDFAPRPPAPTLSLETILAWSEQDWDIMTRGRAHRRARYPMWQRTARILQGRPADETKKAHESHSS